MPLHELEYGYIKISVKMDVDELNETFSCIQMAALIAMCNILFVNSPSTSIHSA